MTHQKIDFYYDFLSPWAYFAWLDVKRIVNDRNLNLRLHPVAYPQLAQAWKQRAIATIPPKRAFIFKFSQRYAKRNNIPFSLPKVHPFKPYTALRLSLEEVCGEDQRTMVDTLFQACWVDGIQLDLEQDLISYLSKNGFDGESMVRKTQRDSVKSKLKKEIATAVECGVFGVPTMIIDDELFWGCDQIADIENFLNGNGGLISHELPSSSWGLEHRGSE